MVEASFWMMLGSYDLSRIEIHAERVSGKEIHPVGLVAICVSLEGECPVIIGFLFLVPLLTGEPAPAGAIGGAADAGVGVPSFGAGVGTLTC